MIRSVRPSSSFSVSKEESDGVFLNFSFELGGAGVHSGAIFIFRMCRNKRGHYNFTQKEIEKDINRRVNYAHTKQDVKQMT